MAKHVFTPEAANALLAEVSPLVERMVAAKRALDGAQAQSDETQRNISGNGGNIPPAELGARHEELSRRATDLADVLAEIQELGVIVKDLDAGIVDFPSVRAGEAILLCWRLGEDEIAYWHGLEDGFAGRQPL